MTPSPATQKQFIFPGLIFVREKKSEVLLGTLSERETLFRDDRRILSGLYKFSKNKEYKSFRFYCHVSTFLQKVCEMDRERALRVNAFIAAVKRLAFRSNIKKRKSEI